MDIAGKQINLSKAFDFVRLIFTDPTLLDIEKERVRTLHDIGTPHEDPELSRKIAYHETGHIATNWDKWPPLAITNLKLLGSDGRANGGSYADGLPLSDALTEASNEDLEDFLIHALSGIEAEKIKYGNDTQTGFGQILSFQLPIGPDHNPPVDAEKARRCCVELAHRDGVTEDSPDFETYCYNIIHIASISTQERLLENWSTIEKIVEALEEKHVLGGSEIMQIREKLKTADLAPAAL